MAPPKAAYWKTKGCSHSHTRAEARRALRRLARAPRPHGVRHWLLCTRSRANVTKLRHYWRSARRRYAIDRAIARVTPYHCGSAGNWAIPCGIIACESGFSWSAYNPSGALGPYQLLGWGAPWPVRTKLDKLRHHQIAARIWNGGAGRSNWVC